MCAYLTKSTAYLGQNIYIVLCFYSTIEKEKKKKKKSQNCPTRLAIYCIFINNHPKPTYLFYFILFLIIIQIPKPTYLFQTTSCESPPLKENRCMRSLVNYTIPMVLHNIIRHHPSIFGLSVVMQKVNFIMLNHTNEQALKRDSNPDLSPNTIME